MIRSTRPFANEFLSASSNRILEKRVAPDGGSTEVFGALVV